MINSRSLLLRSLLWVPTLYLAMGIPFNIVNGTAVTMYKSLGISDGEITVALGGVILAWSAKPLWAAFLDMYRTKKFFVLATQVLLAILCICVGLVLPLPGFFQITIALLWVAAFASSTQDICADGIYLTSLDKKTQSQLAGVQGMFWNLGKVVATAWLVTELAGVAAARSWSQQQMWTGVWIAAGAVMFILAIYHWKLLPAGRIEHRPHDARQVWADFVGTATTFFHKRQFWGMIAFVFLYRMGEGLIQTEGRLFLQSSTESGGLGMSVEQVSRIEGYWGAIAFIVGSLLGGMFLGKLGLKRALPILGLCLNVPHFTFVYLSQQASAGQGLDYTTIAVLVSIEKFGYGFGFVGNMVYMMQQLAPGRATMTHYAFATALMNLMLVPTTMVSGPLAEWLGFSVFFIVVMFASIPSVLAAWLAPHPLGDGSRASEAADGTGMQFITVDDPTRLNDVQRRVQVMAGRAAMFATVNVLLILIFDAWALGKLRNLHAAVLETSGAASNTSVMWYVVWVVLILMLVAKAFLTIRTFRCSREAAYVAAENSERIYAGNARGARIASLICLLATMLVLFVAVRLTF